MPPPEHLTRENVELRRWRLSDADLCFWLVRDSLDHLRPWMPWATDDYSLDDAIDYLERSEADWVAGTAFNYLIVAGGAPAGSAGLMARIGAGGLEIGYWVHPAFTGQGVATAASAALTAAAFAQPGIDHVEIHHDDHNIVSGRIPAKLGYDHVETVSGRFEPGPGDSGTTQVWRITRPAADRYRL